MDNAIVKQFMAYSLLVLGYLVVRRYIQIAPDADVSTPDAVAPPGDSVDDIASAIIELVENMEYRQNHAFHIPAADEEATEEVMAWMTKAEEELGRLLDKYVRESGLDLAKEEVLRVKDRRGRQVRLNIRYKDVEEFPDEINYKVQKEVLKNTNWDSKDEV